MRHSTYEPWSEGVIFTCYLQLWPIRLLPGGHLIRRHEGMGTPVIDLLVKFFLPRHARTCNQVSGQWRVEEVHNVQKIDTARALLICGTYATGAWLLNGVNRSTFVMQVNRANKLCCNCLGSEQQSVYMRAKVLRMCANGPNGANFLAFHSNLMKMHQRRWIGNWVHLWANLNGLFALCIAERRVLWHRCTFYAVAWDWF